LNIEDKTIKPITTDFGDQESRIGFGGIVAAGKESFSLVLIARNSGMLAESESGMLTCSSDKQIRMISLEVYGVI
jgi:hypothetical protein